VDTEGGAGVAAAEEAGVEVWLVLVGAVGEKATSFEGVLAAAAEALP
jgi:hypothetical protein